MGNFWIPQFDSFNSSSPSSSRPSSPENAQNTSNEGTHSGTRSAFSSCLGEVFPNRQILPITPTSKTFSFAELKEATRNFSPDPFLGDGDFGTVFKGWIDEKTFAPTKAGSGMAIAVKKLNLDSFQGWEELQTEVNILGSLSHPNIVRLLGHCEKGKELLLVYEFMPGGSLADLLPGRSALLSWRNRLKIAIGVARGLAFLHCSKRKIIHCNLTPYNVLIDWNYNAKISGFGLAKNGLQGENSHVSTYVMGTYGHVAPEYVAPEYADTGHLYVGSDVYSFGVVLLQMFSGGQAFDADRPSQRQNLVKWAEVAEEHTCLSAKRWQLVYWGNHGSTCYGCGCPSEGASRAAELVLECLRSDPRNRPSMTGVVKELELLELIPTNPFRLPISDPEIETPPQCLWCNPESW